MLPPASAADIAVAGAACWCLQTQNRVRNVFMVFVFFFLIVGAVNLMAGFDYAKKKLLW